jgi:hypothetical protein
MSWEMDINGGTSGALGQMDDLLLSDEVKLSLLFFHLLFRCCAECLLVFPIESK